MLFRSAAGGSIGLRPEGVTVHPVGAAPLSGQVELVEALGAETLVYASTPAGAQFVARQTERSALHVGQSVSLSLDLAQAHWFDGAGRIVAAAA